MRRCQIAARSGLDEYLIERLVNTGAPIDVFGVDTALGVSSDAPAIELSYKLVDYAGEPRSKRSPGKANLPGCKQIYWRTDDEGLFVKDILALRDETVAAVRALLRPQVTQGAVDAAFLAEARKADETVRANLAGLPTGLMHLTQPCPYPVVLSPQPSELCI